MAKLNSTWGERLAAACAVVALFGALVTAVASCGGEDLIVSGEFPTETPVRTRTATETPDPDEDI